MQTEKERTETAAQFQMEADNRRFLNPSRAGGVGLIFTAAKYMII